MTNSPGGVQVGGDMIVRDVDIKVSDGQAQSMKAALRLGTARARISVSVLMGENRGYEAAGRVLESLQAAGWQTNSTPATVAGLSVAGIVVFVRSAEPEEREHSAILTKGLAAAGIHAHVLIDPNIPVGHASIVFGRVGSL